MTEREARLPPCRCCHMPDDCDALGANTTACCTCRDSALPELAEEMAEAILKLTENIYALQADREGWEMCKAVARKLRLQIDPDADPEPVPGVRDKSFKQTWDDQVAKSAANEVEFLVSRNQKPGGSGNAVLLSRTPQLAQEWFRLVGMIELVEDDAGDRMCEQAIRVQDALDVEAVTDTPQPLLRDNPSKGYLSEAITEQYGKRCADFDPTCHTCGAWREYDAQPDDLHGYDPTICMNVQTEPATCNDPNPPNVIDDGLMRGQVEKALKLLARGNPVGAIRILEEL